MNRLKLRVNQLQICAKQKNMYKLVRIIDQKEWYTLKIVKTSPNIHESVRII